MLEQDIPSRSLAHADRARLTGALELPSIVKLAMRGMAKVMTTTAYKI